MAQQAAQAAQSGPPTRNNDTDGEADFEVFKDIPAEKITIAIFCALSYESVAVKYTLDEEFNCRPKTIGPRKYVYSFGRIGDHYIVIARPHQMGTVKAAQCAMSVSQQFPSVRLALMVGIGAGIPSPPKYDIRLGDIAVSIPQDDHSGVLEYDFGKYEDGAFVLKGSLDKPPPILISADGSLEEDEIMNRSPLRRILRDITKQPGYARPNSEDILYDENFHHVNKGSDCRGCEVSTERMITPRAERDKKSRQPVVHRGLILSGGGVVKNSKDRDRLRRGHTNAICFEMEAAGIMDEIPCLVIRGICDYADSHKQDGWHCYAAAVAAAYSKAVLLKVYGQEVEGTRSIKEIMEKLENGISQISKDIHVLKREAKDTKGDIRQEASVAKREAILDWLTPINHGLQHSDFLKRREPGTGQWLLDSEQYQAWLKTSKETLFCPGIPGAGKTILTSIVVDDICKRFGITVGISYVYINVQRKDEQRVDDLLTSLLRQLVGSQQTLPAIVTSLYNKHKVSGTRPSLEEISGALHAVVAMYTRVFIIIDALDECETSDGSRTKFLSEIFNLRTRQTVNIFATSRFLPDITSHFKDSISLEIRANPEDVARYLESKMEQLPYFVQDSCKLQEEIKTGIIDSVHGMFLLAQLYFGFLDDKMTPNDIRSALRAFRMQDQESSGDAKGQVLSRAYEQALQRINEQKPGLKELAMKVLSWITYAKRQLTSYELQHALGTKVDKSELDQGDLPQIGDMISVCLGLVTVDEETNIIRFVHYTTQEYFERTREDRFPDAESELTTICATYLTFNLSYAPASDQSSFFDYAACYWPSHAHGMPEQASLKQITKLIEMQSKTWYHRYLGQDSEATDRQDGLIPPVNALHCAASLGLVHIVRHYLDQGYDIESYNLYGATPIWQAACFGHFAVVQLLADRGADVAKKNKAGETLLHWALAPRYGRALYDRNKISDCGFALIADLTIFKNSRPYDFHLRGKLSRSILYMLIERMQFVDIKDSCGRTPLLLAAQNGDWETIRRFTAKGASVHMEDADGLTPLVHALQFPKLESVFTSNEVYGSNVLIGYMAELDLTAISPSIYEDPYPAEPAIASLFGEQVDFGLVDEKGRTILALAVEKRYLSLVTTFLHRGVDPNTPDVNGRTPLILASRPPHIGSVVFQDNILSNNTHTHIGRGLTLHYDQDNINRVSIEVERAAKQEAIIKLLLDAGANIHQTDVRGMTALDWAARCSTPSIVRLLQSRGAIADSESIYLLQRRKGSFGDFAFRNMQEYLASLLLVGGLPVWLVQLIHKWCCECSYHGNRVTENDTSVLGSILKLIPREGVTPTSVREPSDHHQATCHYITEEGVFPIDGASCPYPPLSSLHDRCRFFSKCIVRQRR